MLETKRKRTKHDTYKVSLEVTPMNQTQGDYLSALRSSNQVIAFGPAGTGKTYVVSSYAASLYHTKEVNKIVITRPHIPVGRDIGYLPGSLEEKVYPWALPVLDVLEKHLGKGVVDTGIKNGNIEMAPLALMRGRSFENSFVICDEAQNTTTHELKMLTTRIGEGSTLVLNGDIQQSDLRQDSGLAKVIHLVKKHMLPVPIIEFGIEDIVRSDICAMWSKVFFEEKI